MYINNTLSVDKVEKIASFAKIGLIIIFIILLFSFWSIQILRHKHYDKLALGNITDDIEIIVSKQILMAVTSDFINFMFESLHTAKSNTTFREIKCSF